MPGHLENGVINVRGLVTKLHVVDVESWDANPEEKLQSLLACAQLRELDIRIFSPQGFNAPLDAMPQIKQIDRIRRC